ncbi:hypothetical protein [Neorhodopirellula lusitana]|uniref:hypothetical protein n=1 Tax=Neorhodopirellula lusitana TaxID=445327 RepID=UPI00384AC255
MRRSTVIFLKLRFVIEGIYVRRSASHAQEYHAFGARFQGLQATYPIPSKNADAWMVTELTPGTIENCEGIVRCSKALDHPKYWI